MLGMDASGFEKGAKKADLSLGKLAKRVATFAAGFAAAFVGLQLGKKLFNVGRDFDALTDTIRVGTGKTGDELKGLTDVALNVFKSIPTSMDAVGAALTQIQQITGATGTDLENLTKTQLELARVTGTDVTTNIQTTSQAFQQWGVATADQTAKLDMLFRASQATGVPVATLAQQLSQYGPILRQMGFDLDSSTALLGTLGKAGLDAGQVITGLRTAFKTFAEAGVTDTNAALRGVFDQIKNAPSDIAAGQLAIDTFGSRVGPALADSIRGGRLEYGTLLDIVQNGSDTILGAAADTNDLAENWQIFKNRLSVAVLPVATKLFAFLNAKGIPALEKLIGFIEKMDPNLRMAALGFGVLLGLIGPAVSLIGALGGSILLLLGPVGLLVAALALIGVAYKKNWLGFADGVKRFVKWFKGLDFKHGALGDLVDIFQDLAKGDVKGALREIQNLIGELGDILAGLLERAGLTHFAGIVRTTFHDLQKLFGDVVSFVTNLIHGNWSAAWHDFVAICSDMVKLAWDRFLMIPALLLDAFNAIPWGTIGAFLLSGAATVASWLIDQVAQLPGLIVDAVLAGTDLLYDLGRELLSWVWTGIASLWNWIAGQVSNLPGALVQAIEWSYGWFYTIGRNIISYLWTGIASLAQWIYDQVSNFVSGLIGMFSDVPGFSPFEHAYSWLGQAMMKSLAGGLNDGAKIAAGAAADARDRVFGAMSAAGSLAAGTNAAVTGVGGTAIGAGGSRSVTVNVNGAQDPEATARAVLRAIRRVEAGAH